MKKKPIKQNIEIELHTTFKLTYMENVTNIAIALARSGYLIKIVSDLPGYILEVYKRPNTI